ncbi:M23 family metallopeptidase [Halovenus halobia]|uniref:M23 family metallopeptidase n=1 Tax=Halovenus halobia TaxID=3396622 RepID=UPI003F56B75C
MGCEIQFAKSLTTNSLTEQMMTAKQTQTTNWAGRLREWLRRADPTRLGLLGALSLPSYVVDSLAFLEVFSVFFLFFLWILVGPIVDAVLKRGAEESTAPTDWLEVGDWREMLTFYATLPLLFANPLLMLQDVFQMAGSAVAAIRHRGSLPARGDERAVEYRLPVDGEWTVVNGSLDREFSHSWFPVNQRYAYDFVKTDDAGRSRPEGASAGIANYYCYDEPVLAPADGVVVDVFESDLEPNRGGGFSHPLKRDIRGNYVTVQHAPGEFSCLAHLVPGSVTVKPGDSVDRGQRIGRCGHTGNSSEPHLHFQVQDSPTFETAASLPVEFAGVSTESPWLDDSTETPETVDESPTGVPTTDGGATAITAGQRVEQHETLFSEDHEYETNGRRLAATLERTALGLAVGVVLAVVGGFVFDQPALLAGLASLAGVGLAGWAAGRLVVTPRTGGTGIGLGLGIAAALWWVGLGLSTLGAVAVAVVCYGVVAEIDRLVTKRGFAQRSG